MRLDPAGREYIYWPVTNPDAVTLEASIDRVTWVTATVVADSVRLLFTGPDVVGSAGEPEILLPRGRSYVTFRAIDAPEILIRGGDPIDVNVN